MARAKVWAVGPSLGLEIKGLPLPPFNGSFGSIDLEDDTSVADPDTLDGAFMIWNAGYTGGIGVSCSLVRIGSANGRFRAKSASCGWSYGFDIGASTTLGSATVISSSVSDCDGCKK